MALKILVVNGPNLNLLGRRDPGHYGCKDLSELSKDLEDEFSKKDILFEWVQSNHEGELVDQIQRCMGNEFHGLIINPAAYSHTSLAIKDALECIKLPKVEVHLSNVHARENIRKQMLTASAVDTVISGSRELSYQLAVVYILKILEV